MIERGEQLRFALEPRETIRVADEGVGQHLDRDVAAQLGVARAIDLAHAAGAERRDDFIGPESVPAASNMDSPGGAWVRGGRAVRGL